MADRGLHGQGRQLGIQQLFLEAQNRWLRPAEICEILRSYNKFHIASEPPHRPPSGSLFLFDRKVLRYFRKDGHIWRKKKDGKTIKEAHEKLKVGSVDVLHCYYAHGEENESFQRRSYWMLEEELMHIVFVHYLEVKGGKMGGSPSSSFAANHIKEPSGVTDSATPSPPLSSFCEDSDSADSHQARIGCHSFIKSPKMQAIPVSSNANVDFLSSCGGFPVSDLVDGEESTSGMNRISFVHRNISRRTDDVFHIFENRSLLSQEHMPENDAAKCGNSHAYANSQYCSTNIGEGVILNEMLTVGCLVGDKLDCCIPPHSNWQDSNPSGLLNLPNHEMDSTVDLKLEHELVPTEIERRTHDAVAASGLQILREMPIKSELEYINDPCSEADASGIANGRHAFLLKQQPSLDRDGLGKVDSFSRWITKELGEVDDFHMELSSGVSWNSFECANVVDDSSLSPSLSQYQLFTIVDFSPKWAYSNMETEVHIIGTFLMGHQEVSNHNWSCMFGEVEVAAEVLVGGIICCYAPIHTVGTVPFYVTCSNRLACSELREFDYRPGFIHVADLLNVYADASEIHLHQQLERLLSLQFPSCRTRSLLHDAEGAQELIHNLILLKDEDDSSQIDLVQHSVEEQILQKLMKEKLHSWLVHKVGESGEGPTVLGCGGQGVLHLVSALGFDWAVRPSVTSGININFRDANGWTALHWAAFYGREKTVAMLVSLGAAPGALTDPSMEFPLGRTAADLASIKGHKGISGLLAESSLTNYLSFLTMADKPDDPALKDSVKKTVLTISERTSTPVNEGDFPEFLSMKDSLSAVTNATQAASRIYQVFRMQSFQRKQLADKRNNDVDSHSLDEHAISLVAKMCKPVQSDGISCSAATHIQKKFRGWKKRKEFLIIRQRIVKIQAHVRGHQARKQFRKIIWSVGILEKIILRWRRKRSGLRGFRRDALAAVDSDLVGFEFNSHDDDYDFLREGRKQNEERIQKALSRVRSMFQYPEGQAQYRRLLTIVENIRHEAAPRVRDVVRMPEPEPKPEPEPEPEPDNGEVDLFDIDSLLDDDFMSLL